MSLIEQMRRDRKFVLLAQGLTAAADFISSEDADQMMDALQDAIRKAHTETSPAQDLDLRNHWEHFDKLLLESSDGRWLIRHSDTPYLRPSLAMRSMARRVGSNTGAPSAGT